jgi:hypothetical protein
VLRLVVNVTTAGRAKCYGLPCKMKLPGRYLFRDGASPLSLYFNNNSQFSRFVSLTCGVNCRAFHQRRPNSLKTNNLIEIKRNSSLPLSSLSGPSCSRCTFESITNLASGCRGYSTGDGRNDKNEETPQPELKGVVVHVPNPLLWVKNKWYSYLIRFSVDPAFNLEEFLAGAKQVGVLLIFCCQIIRGIVEFNAYR